jgi:1-acyl-sn-glycerol-3-phosphate acyltransferase
VVGWLARLNRTVFVSREDRLGVAEQINRLRETLADNWAITIFPEGTTTDGQSLLPFKTSMLRVLEPPPPGVLVQPVALDYGAVAEWIGWIGTEGGIANAMRVLARRGSFRLDIHFLDPFDPRDYPGRKAIAAEARNRIVPAIERNLGKPLRRSTSMCRKWAIAAKSTTARPDWLGQARAAGNSRNLKIRSG